MASLLQPIPFPDELVTRFICFVNCLYDAFITCKVTFLLWLVMIEILND